MRIISFIGYQDKEGVVIKGRLISQEYKVPKKESSWWKNMRSNVSRAFASPIKKARVTITFENQQRHVRSDKRGFFQARFHTKKRGWQQGSIKAKGEQAPVKVLCSTNKKGLISDVDDTFLTTHSNNFFKKVRLFLLKNAQTREAVEGMPFFYRETNRQLFYVSSSSWELYDLIREFCEAQDMPTGPFLLSDKKITALKRDHNDKERRILDIINGYDTSFILVGDDAQRDPAIYAGIANKHPEKIEAIFIRSVKDTKKTKERLARCEQPCFVASTAKQLYKAYREHFTI